MKNHIPSVMRFVFAATLGLLEIVIRKPLFSLIFSFLLLFSVVHAQEVSSSDIHCYCHGYGDCFDADDGSYVFFLCQEGRTRYTTHTHYHRISNHKYAVISSDVYPQLLRFDADLMARGIYSHNSNGSSAKHFKDQIMYDFGSLKGIHPI